MENRVKMLQDKLSSKNKPNFQKIDVKNIANGLTTKLPLLKLINSKQKNIVCFDVRHGP